MQRRFFAVLSFVASAALLTSAVAAPAGKASGGSEVDRLLALENAAQKITVVAPVVDDVAFLRRVFSELRNSSIEISSVCVEIS